MKGSLYNCYGVMFRRQIVQIKKAKYKHIYNITCCVVKGNKHTFAYLYRRKTSKLAMYKWW